MSGPWEKYVERAAEAIDPAAFDPSIENHAGYVRQFRRDKACGQARVALAAVGPLIQEDARERMVAAAGAALEREGAVDPYCQLAEIRELHAAIPVPQPSQFTAWCNECSTSWPCVTAKILEGE